MPRCPPGGAVMRSGHRSAGLDVPSQLPGRGPFGLHRPPGGRCSPAPVCRLPGARAVSRGGSGRRGERRVVGWHERAGSHRAAPGMASAWRATKRGPQARVGDPGAMRAPIPPDPRLIEVRRGRCATPAGSRRCRRPSLGTCPQPGRTRVATSPSTDAGPGHRARSAGPRADLRKRR